MTQHLPLSIGGKSPINVSVSPRLLSLHTRKSFRLPLQCSATQGNRRGIRAPEWIATACKTLSSSLNTCSKPLSLGLSGFALTALLATGTPAIAADFAATGKCLLGNCQVELAKCMADGQCVENLICLQQCNGRPDEAECQIRCGDLYADKAIESFTACAVSEKQCVPQKVDEDKYPVPKDDYLDKSFDYKDFQGRWYITAGLNPLFDTFDCQEHYFGVNDQKKLVASVAWRIPKNNNDFIERSTIQTFVPAKGNPSKMENFGNDYLDYTDDWYILGYKPDAYAVIYYIGNNDAWKGYGGATVYTRSDSFPEEYRDEIEAALKPMNLSMKDFKITDNTCGPHPKLSAVDQAEEVFVEEVDKVGDDIKDSLQSFGRGFTILQKNNPPDYRAEETPAAKEIREGKAFIAQLRKERPDGALKQDKLHQS